MTTEQLSILLERILELEKQIHAHPDRVVRVLLMRELGEVIEGVVLLY